jgi:SNF2 family DNA or RNA helicase
MIDQMGCGKTLSAIALAWQYRIEWPCLIVVPSSVRGSWADELERWLPSVLPDQIAVIRSGQDVSNMQRQIVLVTYGLLQQKSMKEMIVKQGYKVVIVDECHYMKSRTAKRTMT